MTTVYDPGLRTFPVISTRNGRVETRLSFGQRLESRLEDPFGLLVCQRPELRAAGQVQTRDGRGVFGLCLRTMG